MGCNINTGRNISQTYKNTKINCSYEAQGDSACMPLMSFLNISHQIIPKQLQRHVLKKIANSHPVPLTHQLSCTHNFAFLLHTRCVCLFSWHLVHSFSMLEPTPTHTPSTLRHLSHVEKWGHSLGVALGEWSELI